MLIKTFLTLSLILAMPIWIFAQTSKFTIAFQTTTIETPPPLADFEVYGRNRNISGTQFHKDFSLEIIARVYLKEHIALRLRTGVTKYDFDQQDDAQGFFRHINLTGKLEKYALGIETTHLFGKSLAFRFGGDLQLGLFKEMIDLNENTNGMSQITFETNNILSLNPFLGGDWLIGRGFALGAEFRMPFERVRYRSKGTTVFNNNNNSGSFDFDQESIGFVGFGTPVSSIQLSYRF
ncbi:MAG: hypothetical protein RIS64_3403 [Bacteroidota bacterium]|jgi:hypothetical protein